MLRNNDTNTATATDRARTGRNHETELIAQTVPVSAEPTAPVAEPTVADFLQNGGKLADLVKLIRGEVVAEMQTAPAMPLQVMLGGMFGQSAPGAVSAIKPVAFGATMGTAAAKGVTATKWYAVVYAPNRAAGIYPCADKYTAYNIAKTCAEMIRGFTGCKFAKVDVGLGVKDGAWLEVNPAKSHSELMVLAFLDIPHYEAFRAEPGNAAMVAFLDAAPAEGKDGVTLAYTGVETKPEGDTATEPEAKSAETIAEEDRLIALAATAPAQEGESA